MKQALLWASTLALVACSESEPVREGTITFRGDTYRTVTREITSASGTFQRRTVFIGVRRAGCSATDDRDCHQEIIDGCHLG